MPCMLRTLILQEPLLEMHSLVFLADRHPIRSNNQKSFKNSKKPHFIFIQRKKKEKFKKKVAFMEVTNSYFFKFHSP